MNGPPERARKRLKKPKVKTGCSTCKTRRVKCDETKPECLRCQKFRARFCDGYGDTTRAKAETKAIERRMVLPKGFAIPLAPKREPSLQGFENQVEFASFRTYCEEVAPRLSFTGRNIWHQLLLQAGQDKPFIRHAIMSIGNFNMSPHLQYSSGSRALKSCLYNNAGLALSSQEVESKLMLTS